MKNDENIAFHWLVCPKKLQFFSWFWSKSTILGGLFNLIGHLLGISAKKDCQKWRFRPKLVKNLLRFGWNMTNGWKRWIHCFESVWIDRHWSKYIIVYPSIRNDGWKMNGESVGNDDSNDDGNDEKWFFSVSPPMLDLTWCNPQTIFAPTKLFLITY